MSDILQVQGINSKGFGMIPKLVMQDRRLTAQAKAIYSYFASYAGAGQTAFPSRVKILSDLNIGKNAYYKSFHMLIQCGYISATQEKDKRGRFKRNVYMLLADIPAVSPCTQNEYTVPCHTSGDTEPCPPPPCPVNEDTVYSIKNNKNKNKQFLSKSNSPSVPAAPISAESIDGQYATGITAQQITDKENITRRDIGYEYFYPHDLPLVDEIVAIIIDTALSPELYITIDGEKKLMALVSHRLSELNHEDIEHVIGQYTSLTTPIKRKRQYLLTMLYNTKHELEAHYMNEASNNFEGW